MKLISKRPLWQQSNSALCNQGCHAEPLAPDAVPGCYGETSLHQLWWCQGWEGRDLVLEKPDKAFYGLCREFYIWKATQYVVPFRRWRCWSASLQCLCQMWCWVSTWATQRVKETPNWVISTILLSLKGQHRPPLPQLSSMCTTNAGTVNTPRAINSWRSQSNRGCV